MEIQDDEELLLTISLSHNTGRNNSFRRESLTEGEGSVQLATLYN